MALSFIFESNLQSKYFEKKIIEANRWFKNTDHPYRAWLFRESDSVKGGIILMRQAGANTFDNYILCYHPDKDKKWDSNPRPSYMKIYRSSSSTDAFDIDEIIANLCTDVYKMDAMFCPEYMIKPGVLYEPMLVKEEFSKIEKTPEASLG